MGKIVRPFRCDILTPEGVWESIEAVSVVFPAADGMMGVLGGRAPLAAAVGAGPLMVEEVGGGERDFFVSGGFARMADDVLTILAEECSPVSELDPEAAWQEIQDARQLPMDTPAQTAHRDDVLYAARAKFKLVQERGKGAAMKTTDDLGQDE